MMQNSPLPVKGIFTESLTILRPGSGVQKTKEETVSVWTSARTLSQKNIELRS